MVAVLQLHPANITARVSLSPWHVVVPELSSSRAKAKEVAAVAVVLCRTLGDGLFAVRMFVDG